MFILINTNELKTGLLRLWLPTYYSSQTIFEFSFELVSCASVRMVKGLFDPYLNLNMNKHRTKVPLNTEVKYSVLVKDLSIHSNYI